MNLDQRAITSPQREKYLIIFKDIHTLSVFFQENIDSLKLIDPLDFKRFSVDLRKQYNLYYAKIITVDTNSSCDLRKKAEFLHFLADAFLLKERKIFLSKPKDSLEFWFSKRHFPFREQKIAVKCQQWEKYAEQKTFINEITYDRQSRQFVIDYLNAPNLYLFDNVSSFMKGLSLIKNHESFPELIMAFVTAFDTIKITEGDFHLANFPDERNTVYRFLFNLTEAFCSQGFEKTREYYGFYLLRWLKTRLFVARSITEQRESVEAYFSLLIEPKEKWVWKFVDVEKEIINICKNGRWKQIILVDLAELREKLLPWLSSRYNKRLSSEVLK